MFKSLLSCSTLVKSNRFCVQAFPCSTLVKSNEFCVQAFPGKPLLSCLTLVKSNEFRVQAFEKGFVFKPFLFDFSKVEL